MTNLTYMQNKIIHELFRWRIADGETLKKFCGYPSDKKIMAQLLLRLECQGILQSRMSTWDRKKIYNLTPKGVSLVDNGDREYAIHEEIFWHTALVSKASGDLSELAHVTQVIPEYEIHYDTQTIPDAIIRGNKAGIEFSIALEMELTKKGKARFIDKIKTYALTKNFDYVLYLFPNEKMKEDLSKLISDNVSDLQKKRFMLFSFKNGRGLHFKKAFGTFQDQEIFLEKIFN